MKLGNLGKFDQEAVEKQITHSLRFGRLGGGQEGRYHCPPERIGVNDGDQTQGSRSRRRMAGTLLRGYRPAVLGWGRHDRGFDSHNVPPAVELSFGEQSGSHSEKVHVPKNEALS